MRITVMGAGGVGGYFGARLARGGCDVGFLARGDHLKAIQTDGLRIVSPLGDLHLPQPRASDDPVRLGPADLILICVKLWDTESAAQAVAPIVGPNTTVISLQNGVERDEILRRVLGDASVAGGASYISSEISGPGVITHTGVIPKLVFGEYDRPGSLRLQALLDQCRAADIDATITADIRLALWEKFVFLVGFSAATTVLDATIGPVRADPAARALLLDLMREVVEVGRAHRVTLDLGFAEDRLAFSDTLPPETTSSMHRDFRKGRRLEVGWLSGAVAKLGRAAGVEAPLNRAVSDILSFRASS
jgi:2-dehydropantoate 2-reductase